MLIAIFVQSFQIWMLSLCVHYQLLTFPTTRPYLGSFLSFLSFFFWSPVHLGKWTLSTLHYTLCKI